MTVKETKKHEPNRRSTDKPTWQKVSHNVILVGSAIAALLMGFRVVGGYYIEQEKLKVMERTLDSLARNVEIVGKRLDAAERELDKRGPRILDNEREIDRLRNYVRTIK